MSTYTPISSITLSASTSSVSFMNISQDYTDLRLVVSGNSAGGYINTKISFNDDAGSSYSFTKLGVTFPGNTPTLSAGSGQNQTSIRGAQMDNADNQFFTVNIMSYKNTNINKSVLIKTYNSDGNTYGDSPTVIAGLWRNKNAISSITIATDGTSFASNTTFNLYGIASGGPKAFGGDTVTTDGTYYYHTFTSSGTFTANETLTVDYLVIAGGGAGGSDRGGGGGAGGYRAFTSQSVSSGSYSVVVGAGGAGASASTGNKGSNSSFNSNSSSGGGGGALYTPTGTQSNGGSGGGGWGASGTADNDGGTGNAGGYTPVEGYAGGAGQDGNSRIGGGGGGASEAGNTDGQGYGGDGSNAHSTWASATGTGVGGFYAGGGGAGSQSGGSRPGGDGGGATGQQSGDGAHATANTGSGGAGAGDSSSTGGNGGSGIVIVRYPV